MKPSRQRFDNEGASTSSTNKCQSLSINFEETGLSENVYKHVWEKAVEILDKDSNIVHAPGENTAMLVVSKSKKCLIMLKFSKAEKSNAHVMDIRPNKCVLMLWQ